VKISGLNPFKSLNKQIKIGKGEFSPHGIEKKMRTKIPMEASL